MAEAGSNIDIIFRNGLKDYEVLPPAGAWDVIRPAVRKKQTPVIILRYAAMIVVMLSLSFLAYQWSLSLRGTGNNTLALNPESENGILSSTYAHPAVLPVSKNYTRNESHNISGADNLNRVEEINSTAALAPINPDMIAVDDGIQTDRNTLALKENHQPDPIDPSLNMKLINPFSETPVTDAQKPGRWSIAALVSPTYYSGFNPGNNALTNLLVSEEQPVMSIAGGLSFSYKVSKRFSVQSGLYYASLGNELSGISSFSGFQGYDVTKGDRNFEVLTSNGTVYTSSSDIFLIDKLTEARINTRYTTDVFDPAKANLTYLNNTLIQNFGYIELPFVVRYKFIDKTLGFNIIGGVSSNFLVNNAVYSSLDGGKILVGKTDGVNPVSFSSSLGMGMEYNLGKNLSLNLEPTFRYYLNPYIGADGVRIHPYSFGIFSGLSFKF